MKKMKQRNRRAAAWILIVSMCLSSAVMGGSPAAVKTAKAVEENAVTLSDPVFEAEKGHVVWDCVYFGNYWQSKYITQPGNMPEEGEDDVVHTDDDGTKYIVRADKSCYKYEPIKWRVLSVSEDGTDAFLMADKNLDVKAFHSNYDETVTTDNVMWENSDVRAWLNGTFMETAFSKEEQEAIKTTEIENLSYSSYYDGGTETSAKDGTPTEDRIYLPSLDDMANQRYGFVNNFNPVDDVTEHGFSGTQVREAAATDFAESEGGYKAGRYLLRTLSPFDGYVFSTDGGEISVTELFGVTVDDQGAVRPVLHLDLTKTELWEYAGRIDQDQTEIAPDATPAVPTERPTVQPGVTMAPGQTYPNNPVVDETDLNKNTWDCIYFGNYYNTKITPSVLSVSDDDDTMQTDEKGNKYIVRREQGYFQYEPIKWRVLSINEDGTDAFVMADEVIDLTNYYHDNSVEITWEKSNVREWLNNTFLTTAFNEAEINAIKETTVTTADNKWSGEAGGNDTDDKVYLPSIEEMLETAYGFSSDEKEGDTRRVTTADFAEAGGTPKDPVAGAMVYWLRSPGVAKGCPAQVGDWGEGVILTERAVMMPTAVDQIGVRPVMHVDLSDTALWTYAGQVTPKGVVVPEVKEPEEPAQTPDAITKPAEPTQGPNTTVQPAVPTEQPQTVEPEVKKPGKPAIKKLKNVKGKKVTITLSKKVAGADGYQAAYAVKSSMKGQKVKSFKGTSVTVKGLKKKKTYYFRVRAYAKEDGKTVYGNWGKVKKIKIKK